jgi:hypothetical protein
MPWFILQQCEDISLSRLPMVPCIISAVPIRGQYPRPQVKIDRTVPIIIFELGILKRRLTRPKSCHISLTITDTSIHKNLTANAISTINLTQTLSVPTRPLFPSPLLFLCIKKQAFPLRSAGLDIRWSRPRAIQRHAVRQTIPIPFELFGSFEIPRRRFPKGRSGTC